MKSSASTILKNFLNGIIAAGGGEFCVADLFTFTLLNGSVSYWSTWDQPLTVGGNTYNSGVATQNAEGNPLLKRVAIKYAVGLSIDTFDLTLYALPTNQINTVPILQAIGQGMFDQATVRVQRLFFGTPSGGFLPGSSSLDDGLLTLNTYVVSDVSSLTRTSASLTLKSQLEVLDTQMPKNLYGASCRHVLGDTGCGVNLASFTFSGAVQSGSTFISLQTNLTQPGPIAGPSTTPSLSVSTPSSNVNHPFFGLYVTYTYSTAQGETQPSAVAYLGVAYNQLLVIASPPSAPGATGWNAYVSTDPDPSAGQLQNGAPITIGTNWTMPDDGPLQGNFPPIATNGYFAQGQIKFTSGVLSGQSFFVASYGVSGTGVVTFAAALPSTPATGDTFQITAGCDHMMPTCNSKFSNLIHFGGQPFIPQPETVL